MIDRWIQRRPIGLVLDETQIARGQERAGLHSMSAHLELQLRRQIGLGDLIARRDFNVISAAWGEGRNIEMMQKLRIPVFVLRKDGLGDFAFGARYHRDAGGIRHLERPGQLYAALIVAGDGGLISGQAATEEHRFARQEGMSWTEFRSVFELMQRNAIHRKRGGRRKGCPQKCDSEPGRQPAAATYLGPGSGMSTVESVSMRSGISTHTNFSVPGSLPS